MQNIHYHLATHVNGDLLRVNRDTGHTCWLTVIYWRVSNSNSNSKFHLFIYFFFVGVFLGFLQQRIVTRLVISTLLVNILVSWGDARVLFVTVAWLALPFALPRVLFSSSRSRFFFLSSVFCLLRDVALLHFFLFVSSLATCLR